jgi:hypothetical protein
MHDEYPSETETSTSYYLSRWVIAATSLFFVLMVGGYFFFLGGTTAPTTKRASSGPAQTNESGVELARQGLSRQTDLNACRSALQQINGELSEKQATRPPALTNEQKDRLRENLSLDKEEMSEIESSHFTRLDNQHLFGCFLMRDAANALAVKGVRGQAGGQAVREKPLDQAVRAFAWVMREVRLLPDDGEASPPCFVIRRGWGTALERALIFLALLEQLGDADAPQPELLGFLLQVPDAKGEMRLWACGVVVGDKDVYLFDPYLGLPLPGPNGDGVATLAQAREKAEILAQLNIDDKLRYPVTQEQVRAAQAWLVCPLSALSPRMRYLQEKLLAPAVRVRVASDAAKDAERIKAASEAGATKPMSVQAPKGLCTLLRRFLTADEGGTDTTNRQAVFMRDLVPWTALPTVFETEPLLTQKSILGIQARFLFASSFVAPMMEAGQPRDLLLRGRYGSAVEKLVAESAMWRSTLEQRANSPDLGAQFRAWLDEVAHAYATLVKPKSSAQEREQADKQIQKLWNDRSSYPVRLLINGAAATARNPEVAYQLCLCDQEQAEQIQARLDLQAQSGVQQYAQDVENAQKAWRNAVEHWKRFEEDYAKHPDAAAARRLRGWAEAMLGDHPDAIASWKNVADCRTDLEKIASLYLARQWQKKHPSKK